MEERLGRYMVLKHLASGGMADVLLARTDGIEGFERHVVLKRIRAEHAKDQRFIDMFLDEARLAANLHHQNIVQVHDIGESAGEYFFAMEYLHGEDLRAMLSVVSKTRAHIPLGTVVSIISSVAAGLHYAHERRGTDKKPLNIVHRDVSPSNILVSYDGSVKIVDFGIAKAAMRQGETRSGSLKGKVSYMSPEQCKMGTVDRRSDVYALGVVLYELVTTTRLFKSDSDYLVMDAICTGKIPLPRIRRPDLPNELSTIIMTALATDPERRYQTADELRSALDAFGTKAGLTASASTIGAYVQKLCGEKPEPWLDPTAVDAKPGTHADTVAGTDMTRKSWSELPRAEGTEAKTVTDSKSKRRAAPVIASPVAAEPVTLPTRTSAKLGREKSVPSEPGGSLRPGKIAKIAKIAVPLVALAGLLVWKLAAKSETKEPTSAATVAAGVTSPATGGEEKTVAPMPAPTHVEPAVVTPAAAVVPKPITAKPTAAKPAAAKTTAPLTPTVAKTTASAKTTPPTTAAAAAKITPPTPTVEPTKTPGPTATIAAPTGTAFKTVEPKLAEPKGVTAPPPPSPTAIPALAPGVVEALASRNRKALLACEGTETLSGEVTIQFQVAADGRVSQSALHTTVRKPAVSGCILNVVQSWRFPKPATGSATGVYTISFQ